jgi:hypothetical protein
MENSQERRQEIYDALKNSSKDQYILDEMKRLGFWEEGSIDFKQVERYFSEQSELSTELTKLLKEKSIVEDPEKFIAEKHKVRKLESKQNQKKTKEKREEERIEKVRKWSESKEKDIVYLGEEFSKSLNSKVSNIDRLKHQKLPLLNSAEDIAKAMSISVAELRFLSFSRKNSKISHYTRFEMPKKTGGVRLISAPKPKLKKAQLWILETILNKVLVHPNAHGCVIGKSIKTNSIPHVNQDVVINQDLKNFFPTITYVRVKGVFKSLGYSDQVATIFALLCSEPKIVEVSLLGEGYFAQRGERFLPQGSPCSPAITNVLCKKMDYRLSGLAKKYGFNYSRYVDDITFSAKKEKFNAITAVLKYSGKIVRDENFNLHPDKLRIMKRGVRQEVTGVVVNEKPNVNKKSLKQFRALLYQIETTGIEGKFWGKPGGNVLAQIHGYANFINQIDPDKGVKYKTQVNNILDKYNYKETHSNKYKSKKTKSGGFLNSIINTFKSLFSK